MTKQLSLFQESLPLSYVINGDCKDKLKHLIEHGKKAELINES